MRDYRFRVWNPTTEMMTYNVGLDRISEYADETLVKMQMTGLKDCKGNNIYEGDVINVEPEGHPFVKNWIGIVKFIDGSYLIENLEGTDGEYLFDEIREIEVCGNIYETPELLKQE